MRFQWDHSKAARNLRIHGVNFSEARATFYDPLGMERPDDTHSTGEPRFVRIGKSSGGELLVTAFTERGEDTRIISSRRATRREVRDYEEGV